MTATSIVNAAPMIIPRGTQDLSTRPVNREPEAIPTHLPKVYIFAQKGPETPQLVVGGTRVSMYGEDTFDERKQYCNHATVLSNLINAEGNAQMIQRIVPPDAGPEANLLLSLDVLPTQVPDYQRNSDGSIATDIDGDPIPVLDSNDDPVTVAGFRVKWVVSTVATVAGMANYGQATIVAGDQTDVATSTQSQRYPILQFRASSKGSWGNNVGVRIWSPNNQFGFGVSSRLLAETKTYPYRVSFVKRVNEFTTPRVIENLFSEQSVEVSLKNGVIDPSTDKEMFIGEHLLKYYSNLTDVRYPPLFGDVGNVFVYENNLATVLGLLYSAEMAYISASSNPGAIQTDFTGADDEEHLYNLIGGHSSQGYPYHTLAWTQGGGAVSLSLNTNLFLQSGSDGTLSDTNFNTAVVSAVGEYNNENSELMDVAQNVESIIYDSGFPLQTKYALLNFIARRKDTCVVLGTHTVDEEVLSASEENAVAIALRTRAQLFPESDYFGTPVARCVIMGRSGILRTRQYKKRVPATMEVAAKAARYMGASNGRWKNGFDFDGAPGSILTYMYDINVVYTPAGARNRDWDAGLNWIQRYDRAQLHIPALQTVYSEDTSVLNNFLTVMAICEINKVADRAWRHFSGVSRLSNAQLADRVNNFINDRLQGRFDGRFIIEPDTYFTEADIARGYSWTTAIKLYAANMKTVMTTFVQAYRIEDYQPTN
jgi:hypothetical protein